ncbi:hypothetical protein GGI15_002743 [Coemansia interrupta]|uniref:Uncharacterized protein n=1 Tax=Coemansia interrupta TaxID=1126814 RepID=A0A9W8HI60_9FUNG|nr:hypothetical protein GGI15_002743 [Coemansia interrupta]
MDPMNVSLDLASQIGMSIRDSDENNDVAESNRLYVEQLTADRYNFDDSLEESEEMQATKMTKKLLDKLAANNIQLSAKSAEEEKRDYEEYSDVLDRDIVGDRLKRVRLFAEHLRKVSNNRTSLFARLAEPMAEEHWLLDSSFHERMVDVFRNMSELVNELPDIAIAARHCIAPALSDNEFTDTDTDDTDSRARQIAQMELFVHQVDQLITQTKNAK